MADSLPKVNSLILPASPGMFERSVTAAKEARAPPREWPQRLVSRDSLRSNAGREHTCTNEAVMWVKRVLFFHYGYHSVCDGVERP